MKQKLTNLSVDTLRAILTPDDDIQVEMLMTDLV